MLAKNPETLRTKRTVVKESGLKLALERSKGKMGGRVKRANSGKSGLRLQPSWSSWLAALHGPSATQGMESRVPASRANAIPSSR